MASKKPPSPSKATGGRRGRRARKERDKEAIKDALIADLQRKLEEALKGQK